MKIFRFINDNILFLLTIFLLAFIPLYPKLPVINVQHTWVYVRLEDFVVVVTLLIWGYLFIRQKVSLKTPMTIPILAYWIIGAIATLHGVLIIFPTISNVFSNVALLSLLRRIEYMSLFFVAYSAMKDKKYISWVAILLGFVMLGIVGYGFGQRYLGLPAYLTMNEEFAKGIPIHLSQLSRVPSTFGGQYDLAAYLVLLIPVLVSTGFGFKNLLGKIFLISSATLGFALLMLTVSRVSFIGLLLSLVILFIVQGRKKVIIALGVLALILLSLSPQLLSRFNSTVTEIRVLQDPGSFLTVGQVTKVPSDIFKNKIVISDAIAQNSQLASYSAVIPYYALPKEVNLLVIPTESNGENLPQGTSYINLPLSPVVEKTGTYFYEKPGQVATSAAVVTEFSGEYLIKSAKAYDLSFTTRFQGEWPRTLLAFDRNIFLGSGFGSVSLAVDNDYLRMLGETGLFGFLSFASLFVVLGIYMKKALSKMEDPIAKNFIIGFATGTLALALNAVLIDVFESSKVAFTYWLLMGITFGLLIRYAETNLNLLRELWVVLTSRVAIVIYLLVTVFALFSGTTDNYFVGDDFTWLRWAADCSSNCNPVLRIIHYFTDSGGFFYRPGTKIYFEAMYSFFWLNQTVYHFVSIILHFLVVLLIFFIARRVFRNQFLAAASSFTFLILGNYAETILWPAATGHIFNALFMLFSLLMYIYWKEKGKSIYFLASLIAAFLSMLFHELGIVTPLLLILYNAVFLEDSVWNKWRKEYTWLFTPVVPYLVLRLLSHSHWFNGDYSYSLVKMPFNFIANAMGYFMLMLAGPQTYPVYEKIRLFSKSHVTLGVALSILVFLILAVAYKQVISKIAVHDKKILSFGFLFFIIALLPFLGLGNITFRYSYLASFGFVILLVWAAQKLYGYFLVNGKNIAILLTALVVLIFSSNQLFQLQKEEADWSTAGVKIQKFLSSLDYIYAHYQTPEIRNLYISKVPIKNGDAWVFPVGLSDATWLLFRGTNITMHEAQTTEEAFELRGTGNGKVLEFDDDGDLIEMTKTKSGEIVPLK